MRLILLVFLCSISLQASAQWWRFSKRERLPALERPVMHHPNKNFITVTTPHPGLHSYTLSRSAYSLEVEEEKVMKEAQHNMRFRIYDAASYKFSDLAQLYVQQNRFSEAKWYFLQSSFLSRQQNNDKLTIFNLTKLAMVKLEIGDLALAQQDLHEARDLAASHGWLRDLIEVEKKLGYLQHSRIAALRSDARYAELAAEN
jgi:hypothetical protein